MRRLCHESFPKAQLCSHKRGRKDFNGRWKAAVNVFFFFKTWQGYCTRGFPSVNYTHRIMKSRPRVRRLGSWWVLEEQCQRSSWYNDHTVMILQWMAITPHSSCQAWWAQCIWKRMYELERILMNETWASWR